MSTSDAEYRDPAPHGVVHRSVNHLFRVGLDLHRALASVQHDPRARQRIRAAMARVDDTINELRHAIMPCGERG